jgi:hypothetical protein
MLHILQYVCGKNLGKIMESTDVASKLYASEEKARDRQIIGA